MTQQNDYDVVIVGSGVAGANMAYLLGLAGQKVLILEAGDGLPRSREDYLQNFYLNTFKAPEAPYPPNANAQAPANTNAPRPTIPELVINSWNNGTGQWDDPTKAYLTYSGSALPFASTYERIAGGTGNHWMGTALRMTPNDFNIRTLYGHGRNWPIDYTDLMAFYETAEQLIGVSGDIDDQAQVGPDFGGVPLPMRALPDSTVDQQFKQDVAGLELADDLPGTGAIITGTPAGRNSEPYQNRRVCHGNTNCTPMCPIQAKYDTQHTLRLALDTGNVTFQAKSVVDYITVDGVPGNVTGVHYVTYDDISAPAQSGATGAGLVTATTYILAAHAIENAKILLNSARVAGVPVANRSDQVGRNLMDHPVYLAWGLAPTPVYGYRGPFSTSGIENFRDGAFRADRAPWRVEIGNEGWNWPAVDPYTTGQDYIYGEDNGQLNAGGDVLSHAEYRDRLNDRLTRQFRIGFLVEQEADPNNRVTLSTSHVDNLGIPRPELQYDISDYVKAGFRSAREASGRIHAGLGAVEYTNNFGGATSWTDPVDQQVYNFQGAGHLCGTHVMGSDETSSVVDDLQRSWDHPNLYICGCGSMPSIGTQNPTLTMLAMCVRTVEQGILNA